MKLGWNKRLASALLGLVGLFGMAAPASAVIVTTTYDPSFGPGPLNGYGWKATVNYEIPAECFSAAGTKIHLFGLVLFCEDPRIAEFKVLSAQVGLYADGTPNFLLDVLTFDPDSLPLFLVNVVPPETLAYVISWSLADGNSFSNAVYGDQPFSDDIRFRLVLNGPSALLQFNCDVDVAGCVRWTTAPAPTATRSFINGDPDWRANTALKLGARAVPEPASLALVLLALGAGFAVTRRR